MPGPLPGVDLPYSDAFYVQAYPGETTEAFCDGQCRQRLELRRKGHTLTIGERLEQERDALLELPLIPYDASNKQAGRVSSLSLVRYQGNDYSVPVAYGHRAVLVRGYVHQVVISCGEQVIAQHPRSYQKGDFVYDPLHYLPLLERKVGALDQAAPLAGWNLPPEFDTLRHLLESRLGKRGKREYVQVLRLMETLYLKHRRGRPIDLWSPPEDRREA